MEVTTEHFPLVSIIIPTYNRAHLISETLESVLAQTYKNWECIIVDDGSSDNTAEVVGAFVAKDARFKYVHRPDIHKPGGNGARNYGFEISKGAYVNWFDDDDVMLDNFISVKVQGFDAASLVMLISSGYYFERKKKNRRMEIHDTNNLFHDLIFWKLHIITNSVMFKREFLEGKKLFSTEIIRGQETELFSRLFFKLPHELYKLIDIPLFLYRQHSDTKSSHENLGYDSTVKTSRFLTAKDIFDKCRTLNDKEGMHVFNKVVINIFFLSIENKDYSLSYKIINIYYPLLKHLSRFRAFEFLILGKILVKLKRGSYKLKKRWSNITVFNYGK